MRTRIAKIGVAFTALLLASSASAASPALSGGWIVEASPDFPGFTRITVQQHDGAWQGMVTSRWYGDLTMRDMRVEDGKLIFHLFNGNPRVKMEDIVLERHGASLSMRGKLWDQVFDVKAHKGTAKALQALDFKTTTLPPRRVVPQQNLAATPPMGWSSWNKFATDIDDRSIREIADALVSSGLRDAGYIYVNIDDGWQGTRAKDGSLQPNAKFPDMKALADYVHAKGLKLGIYTSPGPKSCAGFEGSYGHIQQDAKSFAQWGIDYLKYDLCSGEAFYNTADTVYGTYQEMGEALAAAGRPIVYSLCEYGRFDVGSWGRAVGGHLWRTTGDIEDSYAAMAKIGFDKNGIPNHTGPNGWNDPDMLEVGNGGMSADEYKTHFSLWALMAAPLILGNDVRKMSPQTLEILSNREVIAIDQDKAGTQGLPVKKSGSREIWTKKLADGSVAVGLFNRSATPQEIALNWQEIGLPVPAKLRDLWAHQDVTASAQYDVPAHGVILLRAWP
ncbi:alpha-galactosidase [Rhizomicrobium palustre]|uniref:Alpha-galactosidase n=1 Tax=Rhizomicrobium palustre TaxID=189966 RepID=A0A846N329_9PROT|nr:glycoside hydrolase family 27 protein [Rhizomicrobium palustre]NIK89490.1 alpha-galactosidase [Rhizomicrobium palustre]